MSIKIIVNGANGKMGQCIVNNIQQEKDLLLVASADKDDNLAALIKKTAADVVIDFTTAASAFENVTTIIDSKARPVVGTSGLLPEQITRLQMHAEESNIGGIIAANFSIGALLMMKYAADAAKYFKTVEIIERHHNLKQDAPSGTALRTAELIAQNFDPSQQHHTQHENVKGSRGANHFNIPIHAVRLQGLMAHQEVAFGSLGETLTIRHDSISRDAYMPGIFLACRKAMHLHGLIVGLEQFL